MTIRLHRGDLPDLTRYTGAVAIDTETMGLDRAATGCAWCSCRPATAAPTWCRSRRARATPPTSRRCSAIPTGSRSSISRASTSARCSTRFGVMPQPVYCTKIASRLTRTYTDKHGLKDLTREVLGVDLSKQQQSSDWGAGELTDAQVAYAASDVLHLHALQARSSTSCWRARAAAGWPRPASGSFPTGSGSTSPAGPPRTFSPIPERAGRLPVPPRPSHNCRVTLAGWRGGGVQDARAAQFPPAGARRGTGALSVASTMQDMADVPFVDEGNDREPLFRAALRTAAWCGFSAARFPSA